MARGTVIQELKGWREERGLTMEAAGALIVIDGTATGRSTWHAWESGRKIPSEACMFELERVCGVAPNCFYTRPEELAPDTLPSQAGLALDAT